MKQTISLPWPPSANTYWRRHGHTIHISTKGRQYRKDVLNLVTANHARCDAPIRKMFGNIKIYVFAFPPDNRRRDLDNLCKALFDSLEKAGIYKNDNQICEFSISRCPVAPPGKLVVYIEEV